ncbi:HNH endonuclease signature motif containing protein [Pseudonocardia petroleophila]|uniref:DUF222 domain-containing protein n=1 Tax=Pseudonocardia petroleophila TaxID=37331 RepID=A0A7G7MEW7_9PSEU|nr:HNH endonuclease signature motif containing protein [Pseudonocardia petroleophila]QNG51328.1 DUF222 domain-containing protein [Pseudonocardia petroleophila]
MFDTECPAETAPVSRSVANAAAWPSPEDTFGAIVAAGRPGPSGWLALELDAATDDPALLDDRSLVDAVADLDRIASWAAARQARLLAEFARRRPADPRDSTTGPEAISRWAPDEIALALSISRSTAGARLAQARRLTETLTATLAAHEAGEIDGSKVRAICDATHPLFEDAAVRVQDRVLPAAARQSRAQLVAALRRAVIAIDPEGANERHARARRDRRVVVGAEDEGMASLWALLAAPDALAAHQWLTRLARGLGTDDPRGMDARRADLLVGLLTGRVAVAEPDLDVDPSAGADGDGPREGEVAPVPAGGAGPALRVAPVNPGKPLVHVVVPFSTLTGAEHQPCELAGYGPIPADLARRIAADAVWKRLVTDPLSGALLDHGRTTYRPPAALTDFVRARDVHCRSPLCRRRALDSELDHTVPFPHGPTAEHNLTHGCTLHHHEKHSPGWTVVQHPDGTLEWTTPTGHTYVSEPFDYRPEPDPPPRRPGRSRRVALDWASTAEHADDAPPF